MLRKILLTFSLFLLPINSLLAVDWGKELGDHSGVDLKVQSIMDPYIDAVKEISPQFESATGASVTVEGFGYDGLHEKQIVACSQNDGSYDVLFIDGIWIGEFVEADCIEPVEDIWTAEGTDKSVIAWDDYIPSFAGQAIWDDKKMCLPFGGYWHMLHYRTDLFEAEGLAPPKTFDDVMAAAKLFKDNPKYPELDGGYAMNMARGSAAGQQYYEWIYSAGAQPWESNYPGSPDAYADQRGLYNSPESVAFIEWMQEMVNYMPPGVEQYAWDERAKAFTQGKVAMINNWSVRTPLFNDPEISKVKGKFGVALFPHAAGAESVPPVGGWIACVNKHSKNQEAAWDYLKWFASPEIHREWVLMGAPPSSHSAMNDPQINAEQPWTPVLYESSLRAWQELRPRHALTFELIETLGIEVNKALTGESSAQEAMDTANKKIDRLLKSEGYID